MQPAVGSRDQLWLGVADALREMITSGTVPPGTDLVEADLASRFGLSRGPVREALRELARDGLVLALPRRGVVVSTLTQADMHSVYDVREGLEMAAADIAIKRASDAELSALSNELAKMNEAWARQNSFEISYIADLAFHRSVVSLSDSERLTQTYEQMLSLCQVLMRSALEANPHRRLPPRAAAHGNIVRAIQARDRARADAAIHEHYAYAAERLFLGTARRRMAKPIPLATMPAR